MELRLTNQQKGQTMKKFVSINPAEGDCSPMVIILFADGELMYTKGGSCWGLRGEHMIEFPVVDYTQLDKDILDLFPDTHNGYKCVYWREADDDNTYSDKVKAYRAWLAKRYQ